MNPGILTPPTQYATMPRGLLGRPTPVPMIDAKSSFDPRSIDGMIVWLDASDTDTLFSNDAATTRVSRSDEPVAVWRNKAAGSADVVQTVANNRPVWVPSASPSGRPALRFDGLNDGLVSPSFSFTLAATRQLTSFTVARVVGTSGAIFSFKRTGIEDFYSGYLEDINPFSTNSLVANFGQGVSTNFQYRSLQFFTHTASWFVNSVAASGVNGSISARSNGSSVAASNRQTSPGSMPISQWLSQGTGNHAMYVGCRASNPSDSASLFTNCFVSSVLIYNRQLSPVEISAVESWLRQSHGM